MNRPVSSLAEGPHGPVNPIGFYYEDDDEYEVKSMFVADNNNDTQQNQHENDSESLKELSLQREIQERLRHVHHHMYRPSGNDLTRDN